MSRSDTGGGEPSEVDQGGVDQSGAGSNEESLSESEKKRVIEFAIINRVIDLEKRDERGALARLRRGITSLRYTPDLLCYTDVLSWIPNDDNLPHREFPYLLTASLFALHPKHTNERINMGKALRSIASNDSADLRFRHMINAHRDELPVLLRQAISLIAKDGVYVNYHLLLSDLKWWDHPSARVQQRWARDFWS